METNKRRLVANILVDGRIGGPQKRVTQVANLLNYSGWETLVIFPPMGPDLPKYLSKNGLRFKELKLSRLRRKYKLLSIIKYMLLLPYEIVGLIRVFKSYKVDLVHANSMFAFHAVIAARLYGCPVIWHFNDMALPRSVCILMTATFGKLASSRAYSSKQVMDYQRDKSINTALLYPPVDMEKYNPKNTYDNSLQHWPELSRKNNEIILLAIGNINPLKGYEDLLAALSYIKDIEIPWKLLIAGASLDTAKDYSNALVAQVSKLGLKDKVRFLGAVENVAPLLNCCDVFVLCSRSESGPMVLLEAMASEKPIVTTDVGFVREIVQDKINGLIVPPGNIKILSGALQKIIVDKPFRSKLSEKTRLAITKQYTIRGAADAHNKLYAKMLNI